jgi:septation ring formation regulator EzrA
MAGLGEAASIAGLISLAGQTIQATSKLYTFFQTYKTIHTQFERTGQELESLEDVLRQIERVITNATVKGSTPIDVIVTLEARVKECRDDIEKWTKKVELLGLDGAKSTKRVITKLKVTADKAYFTRVREQLCFHRSQINLSLGVLGL